MHFPVILFPTYSVYLYTYIVPLFSFYFNVIEQKTLWKASGDTRIGLEQLCSVFNTTSMLLPHGWLISQVVSGGEVTTFWIQCITG